MIAEAMRTAYREVPQIFEEAGLIDGEKAMSEEMEESTFRPMFWHLQIDSTVAPKKPINVIYSIDNLQSLARADRRFGHPQLRVNVDAIILNKSIADEKVISVIERIETKFREHGYRFEPESNLASPIDNERTGMAFSATKIL